VPREAGVSVTVPREVWVADGVLFDELPPHPAATATIAPTATQASARTLWREFMGANLHRAAGAPGRRAYAERDHDRQGLDHSGCKPERRHRLFIRRTEHADNGSTPVGP